jgi:hypothetical protein
MDEQTAGQPSKRKEKRRGSRFPVVVFVEAKWQAPSGQNVKETAQAMEVSALGGLLDMKTHPKIGSELELTNLLSGEVAQLRAAFLVRQRKLNRLINAAGPGNQVFNGEWDCDPETESPWASEIIGFK